MICENKNMTDEEKEKLLFEYSMKKCAECKALILLKAQIEKMKPYCKELCKNYIKTEFLGNDCYNGVCRNCDKWEWKNEMVFYRS